MNDTSRSDFSPIPSPISSPKLSPILYWIPAFIQAIVIFYLTVRDNGSNSLDSTSLGEIPFIDKYAHAGLFFILGITLLYGFHYSLRDDVPFIRRSIDRIDLLIHRKREFDSNKTDKDNNNRIRKNNSNRTGKNNSDRKSAAAAVIGRGAPVYLAVILIGSLYGIFDELFQLTVPGRSGTIYDVMADSIGILLACGFDMLYLKYLAGMKIKTAGISKV